MTSPAEAGAGRRAVVVGTGLIGGSIALGLRRRGWHVSGLDADAERVQAALDSGVIDAAGDDPGAEVVFVATPAAAAAGVAQQILRDEGRRADAVGATASGGANPTANVTTLLMNVCCAMVIWVAVSATCVLES